MIAKRVQAGLAETWPLAQVQWTAAHTTATADIAAAAPPQPAPGKRADGTA